LAAVVLSHQFPVRFRVARCNVLDFHLGRVQFPGSNNGSSSSDPSGTSQLPEVGGMSGIDGGFKSHGLSHSAIHFAAVFGWLQKMLSPNGVLRWRALAACPLFIMSAYTNFYFFGGEGTAQVLLSQIWRGMNTAIT